MNKFYTFSSSSFFKYKNFSSKEKFRVTEIQRREKKRERRVKSQQILPFPTPKSQVFETFQNDDF